MFTTELHTYEPALTLLQALASYNTVSVQVGSKFVVKSGSDFQNASILTLHIQDKQLASIDIEEVTLDSSVPEDLDVKSIVDGYLGMIP